MGSINQLVGVFVVYFMSISFVFCNDLARGFNDNINWVSFEEGKDLSLQQNKPMMLIIHKTWCGACKALKKDFTNADNTKEIEEISSRFIMVNAEDEEEPTDEQFKQDGGYIPRIFFLNPAGEVQADLINEGGNANYKYYYSSVSSVVTGMKRALAKFETVEEADDKKQPVDEL